ncbi:MAG: tRNA (adenosine(37)-N6)-threonylcarbamoyltransferase complex dimerization subunit type 1 TsaB [Bacteroidales bacterium]|nr:tRNA (adenosine(37)-N6)-threonylcarbamoyltransferase complex dimerization subunit type 1 TsaB [Bacteroidales bacterium]
MSYFINIETSTDICSVALSQDNNVIDFKENHERNHAASIGVYIQELLNNNNLKVKDLAGVAICKGPGSYTGLRIGTSTGKGLAYQADIKLIAVDTLQAMALHVADNFDYCCDKNNCIICSTIDAGRNEAYTELFDIQNNCIKKCEAIIFDENSFNDILINKKIIFVGNAVDKISKIIKNENAIFINDVLPSATYMAKLTNKQFLNNDFVDVAYFEPFYLKDFIAIKSNKNVLIK